jgi:hypothetical protein
MPHRIYRGTKVYFIRSPHPCLYRGPPSGHASPLGYFDRVIFLNYKGSAGRGKLGLPGSQGKQASQIDERLVKDHLQGVGATEISICKSPTALPTSSSGRSKGERDVLSH